MKVVLSLFLLLLLNFQISFCQDVTKSKDTIAISGTTSKGLRFSQHGENLNLAKLSEILKPNPKSYVYIQKAKTNNTFGIIFSAIGGFAIGWELGSTLGGKSINWGIMGGGIGMTGISIPFNIGAKRNAIKAVNIYNSTN